MSLEERRSVPERESRISNRVIIDATFAIFILTLTFEAGIETQRLNNINGDLQRLQALDVAARLTALDERQRAVVQKLDAIGTKQDGMLDQLTRITTRVEDGYKPRRQVE